VQSSVESRASRWGSCATNLATNSSARNAREPGQCSAAVKRRFANAAARQGGTDARGANARCSARKRRSLVDVITADDAAAVAAAVVVTISASVLAEAVLAAVAPRGDGVGGAALFFLQLELGDAASISGVKPQLSD
jgi:hypothetical protein